MQRCEERTWTFFVLRQRCTSIFPILLYEGGSKQSCWSQYKFTNGTHVLMDLFWRRSCESEKQYITNCTVKQRLRFKWQLILWEAPGDMSHYCYSSNRSLSVFQTHSVPGVKSEIKKWNMSHRMSCQIGIPRECNTINTAEYCICVDCSWHSDSSRLRM
jgi:hypothetical protein